MPNRALKSRSRDEDECGGDPFACGCVVAGKGRVRGSAMTDGAATCQQQQHNGRQSAAGRARMGWGERESTGPATCVFGLEEHVTLVAGD